MSILQKMHSSSLLTVLANLSAIMSSAIPPGSSPMSKAVVRSRFLPSLKRTTKMKSRVPGRESLGPMLTRHYENKLHVVISMLTSDYRVASQKNFLEKFKNNYVPHITWLLAISVKYLV